VEKEEEREGREEVEVMGLQAKEEAARGECLERLRMGIATGGSQGGSS